MELNTKRANGSHGHGSIGEAATSARSSWKSKKDVNLRKNGFLHFQIGLIIALILVYGGFEASFRILKTPEPNGPYEDIIETEYILDLDRVLVEKEKTKPVKPQKKRVLQKIVEVKNDFKIKEGKKEFVQKPNKLLAMDFTMGNSKSKKEPEKITEAPITAITEVPIFPGCEGVENEERLACFQKKMKRHIKRNFHYPDMAIETQQEGRVSVLFKIDEFGKVSDIQMKGPAKVLENEAKRIILKLPEMTPGKLNGKPVRVLYSIPINFQLD